MLLTNTTVARSAIAHPSRPGRIYAEVYTGEEARKVARCSSYLNPHALFPVAREELLPVLHIKSPLLEHLTWARVRDPKKGWKDYRDDVGLVVIDGPKRVLWLVPRLPGDLSQGERPLQNLFARDYVNISVAPPESVRYKGRQYTPHGFLEVKLETLEVVTGPEVLPNPREFKLFRESGILETPEIQKTESDIAARCLKVHDRVKVIGGEMRGLMGTVVGSEWEEEFLVYLPSLDLVESIRRVDLRAQFKVGDKVKVLSGPHEGINAWIIGVSGGQVRIMNLSQELEVRAPLFEDNPPEKTWV